LTRSRTRFQASIDQVSNQVSDLEKSLGDLRAAVQKLQVQGVGAGVVHDGQWLLAQNPKAYTVQLVTSPSQADMARFIDRNVKRLALDSLAFSVSTRAQRTDYQLFFGVFTTVTQARAAIAALPPELHVNGRNCMSTDRGCVSSSRYRLPCADHRIERFCRTLVAKPRLSLLSPQLIFWHTPAVCHGSVRSTCQGGPACFRESRRACQHSPSP